MPQRPSMRDQAYLLPPTVGDMIDPDHPVRFVDVFVDSLGDEVRAELGLNVAPDRLGAPRYDPAILARIWMYGFLSRQRSARVLERACVDQIPLFWLTGNQRPDHNTLWRYYDDHRGAMRALLRQTVRTAYAAGLVDLALMAVDGTKLKANAAADQMRTKEELTALLERTESAIEELEAQNAGADPPLPTLPPELRSAQALKTRVEAAIAQCEEREQSSGDAASVRSPRANVTDPEARWMRTGSGIVPGYNGQAAVVGTNARAQTILGQPAASGRIVVAAHVTTQPTDAVQLQPVLEEVLETLGVMPGVTVADAGYFTGSQLEAAAALGATVVIPESDRHVGSNPYHRAVFVYDERTNTLRCPAGQSLRQIGSSRTPAGVPKRCYGGLGSICAGCAGFGTCTTNQKQGRVVYLTAHDAAIQAQRRTRAFAPYRLASRMRKTLIEAVFGTIKTSAGGRQVMVRGRAKVEAEWLSLMSGVNLRTLCRIWQAMSAGEREMMLRPVRAA